jgi:hypothetical protein
VVGCTVHIHAALLERKIIQIWAEFLFWPKSQGRRNALQCIHPLSRVRNASEMHFLCVAFLNLGLYSHYNNAQLAVSYNFLST